MGESGDEARTGEDESGEGTTGRWSQAPEKIGVGAKDSILSSDGFESECCMKLETKL